MCGYLPSPSPSPSSIRQMMSPSMEWATSGVMTVLSDQSRTANRRTERPPTHVARLPPIICHTQTDRHT